jgi:hypothetical protein
MLVTAYAVNRPDHQWAIMLVNRDQQVAHTINIEFRTGSMGQKSHFEGKADLISFGQAQYLWHPAIISPMSHPEIQGQAVVAETSGRASPDGPAKYESVDATGRGFDVPAATIMIIRGNLGAVPQP